jgi:hypothetical protein
MGQVAENVTFLVIGGSIEPEEDTMPDTMELEFGKPRPQPPIKASVKVYLPADDMVREYDINGVQGQIKAWEPTIEDRAAVSAHTMAQMLIEHDVDAEMFGKILDYALTGIVTAPMVFDPDVGLEMRRIHIKLDAMLKKLGVNG